MQTTYAAGVDAVRRRLAEVYLADFLKQAWHVIEPAVELSWNWHLDCLCQHLEALADGRIRNLLITVPPGSTKSITVGVAFPSWIWTTKPTVRFLTAANEQSLAIRDAVAHRRLIESDWYKANWSHMFSLTSDQNQKSVFENDKRGYRTTTTVGSSVVGKKGDILILDDANDANRVESEAERKNVNGWWDRSFFNRVNHAKTSARIVIGQRTHDDDLIGHIKKRGDFVELMIPEEFEPDRKCKTVLGWEDPRKEAGELLRPDRFGPEQIREARETLGSRGYAAQHQQRPAPAEGAIFKAAWFRHYRHEASYFWLIDPDGTRRASIQQATLRCFLTVDLATSVKTTADYTCIGAWGDDAKGNLLLLDLLRSRMEGPDIIPAIRDMLLKWHGRFAAVENVAFQLSLIQTAIRMGLPIRERRPDKDKVARAMTATVRFEAGKIWFPEYAPWLSVLEDELLHFPAGKHDDCVDVVSMAANEMIKLYSGTPLAKPLILHPGPLVKAPYSA